MQKMRQMAIGGLRSVPVLLAMSPGLIGCMSEQMQRYVGQDIRAVILDYGPPSGTIDLPDGGRA
jgi:hypothetical protein